MGSKPTTYANGQNHSEETNGYGSFPSQKRSPQETSYMDSIVSIGGPSSRDASLPPSRQSQGSPAFPQDLYRNHQQSNSIHSQRAMHNPSSSFSANHSSNHRAFNMNKQIDGDVSAQLSAHMGREPSAAGSSTSFNPASQPFQIASNQQHWAKDNFVDMSRDARLNGDMGGILSHYNVKRPSVERIPHGSNSRLEPEPIDPMELMPRQDTWNSRSFVRDPRTADYDRRGPQPHFGSGYGQPYFPSQYSPYMPPQQYPGNFIDPYTQNFRQAAINSYAVPSLNAGYAMGNPGAGQLRPAHGHDSGKNNRSTLLEDFRNCSKSNRKYELRDIYGHVVEFSGDQHGSRFIQQKLETANSDEKDQVFAELEVNAVQLMKDVFGNYVVQKFFEHGNQLQKRLLAEKMQGKVTDLSMQTYACRVVQKVRSDDIAELLFVH